MRGKFNKEDAIANLKSAISLLEKGGSRTEFSNILLHTMGEGVCDLHCITVNTVFLQTILDMLPVPVYYKDPMGVYVGCNEALAKLYHKNKKDIIGKTVFDIFTAEEAEMLTSSDTVLLNEKRNEMIEHRGKFSILGGNYHIVHKKVIMTPVGNISGILGIILDVTEQKETEECAWQGEAYYKSLFEHSPIPRIIFDSLNMIEDMNYAAVNFFRNGSEYIGRDITELFDSYSDFSKAMDSGGKSVKVFLMGVENEAIEVLASLTVISVSELPKYAVSFIRMDTML
ncbi:putative PAS/PAC sensor protein [Denitrovibrio acetiphilus DSM 12809]|uniref:Putative PAS/PAC sensor protein n=1 Tax=Denitrovibrio acetiphilus (strain DSM 12809 / NBRC 114555 / N2460) TaxID=522772 RepID=D4H2V5_DENA2|nr:PAS domain-containing protein [Denitrovibrio acetiphilus]ADD68978.1 putative PAS/PAC sensor protein [Denitrovibrio acetiphilus DSM 12809]